MNLWALSINLPDLNGTNLPLPIDVARRAIEDRLDGSADTGWGCLVPVTESLAMAIPSALAFRWVLALPAAEVRVEHTAPIRMHDRLSISLWWQTGAQDASGRLPWQFKATMPFMADFPLKVNQDEKTTAILHVSFSGRLSDLDHGLAEEDMAAAWARALEAVHSIAGPVFAGASVDDDFDGVARTTATRIINGAGTFPACFEVESIIVKIRLGKVVGRNVVGRATIDVTTGDNVQIDRDTDEQTRVLPQGNIQDDEALQTQSVEEPIEAWTGEVSTGVQGEEPLKTESAQVPDVQEMNESGSLEPPPEPSTGGVFIAFGSNVGDRLEAIEAACRAIDEDDDMRIVQTSRLYETEPMYVEAQGRFLNGACEVSLY